MRKPDDLRVVIRPPFRDARGEILNLVDAPFESASVIRSVKGAIRGNHYHKTDYHYVWLHSGRMAYYQRPIGDESKPVRHVIEAGQLFYTPPMYEHVMHFLEESVMFVFARNNREKENYEDDIIRVEPFTPTEQ